MAKSKHVTTTDLKKLHIPGCLTRHQRRAPGKTCSHQWQAGVKARDYPALYEVPTKPKWSPSIASNFGHFRDPYWHNAHHIIPNGSLKTSIANAGKRGGLINLIKQGLLKAEYNLNDKINMVILPMRRETARLLGLPRHLKGDKNEKRSHPAYSNQAERKLRPIMDEYAIKAADARDKTKGKHEAPDAKLSKVRLETLSETLFQLICAVGADRDNLGKSLSELSDQIFSFE